MARGEADVIYLVRLAGEAARVHAAFGGSQFLWIARRGTGMQRPCHASTLCGRGGYDGAEARPVFDSWHFISARREGLRVTCNRCRRRLHELVAELSELLQP